MKPNFVSCSLIQLIRFRTARNQETFEKSHLYASPLQKLNDPISQFVKLGGFRLTLPNNHNVPPKPPKLTSSPDIPRLVAIELGPPEGPPTL